jgi:hypothetical protein
MQGCQKHTNTHTHTHILILEFILKMVCIAIKQRVRQAIIRRNRELAKVHDKYRI